MLYMLTAVYPPERRDAVLERFAEIGVAAPEGIKIVGQWFAIGGRTFEVIETDDMVVLGKWLHLWDDLMSFDLIPLNTLEEVVAILTP